MGRIKEYYFTELMHLCDVSQSEEQKALSEIENCRGIPTYTSDELDELEEESKPKNERFENWLKTLGPYWDEILKNRDVVELIELCWSDAEEKMIEEIGTKLESLAS